MKDAIRETVERGQIFRDSALKPNPTKPEPKSHRMEDMLALRAKTEAGWVLAGALVLSGFLFFRYLNGYVISTGGRDLVHLEFLKPEDFSLRSK
uniref:Uncharacterized protein n=1 Tax=Candidatus Kentrum sp. LFY TaxID=2126342 RepID=A0A450USY3_9GAMM|nr:MAG: hypothetical protein BECKLFY1418A_GA0070994_105128 [Candidatus Kentron sp. LFY]